MKFTKEEKNLLILEGYFKTAFYAGFFLLLLSFFFLFKYPDWSGPFLAFLVMSISLLLFCGNKELIIDKQKGKVILDYRRLVYRRYYKFDISRVKNIVTKTSAYGRDKNCYFLNIAKGPQIYIGVDPFFDLSNLLISQDLSNKRKAPELVNKVANFLSLEIKKQ